MENKRFVIDNSNIESLLGLILRGVNEQINARIVQTLEEATEDSVASSKIVAEEIQGLRNTISGLTHIKIDTFVGALEDMPKDSSVIYLQKDNEEDTTWEMYVTVGEEHLSIGPCTVDLSNCWKKNEVEEMKEALGINDKLEASDLEGYVKSEELDGFMKVGDVEPMTEEQITAAFEKVFNPEAEESE